MRCQRLEKRLEERPPLYGDLRRRGRQPLEKEDLPTGTNGAGLDGKELTKLTLLCYT